MPIDTRAKRASVFGVGRPWMRNTEPDVTTPEAWRLSVGHAYSVAALSGLIDGITTRIILIGQSQERCELIGQSESQYEIIGQSEEQLVIDGTSG